MHKNSPGCKLHAPEIEAPVALECVEHVYAPMENMDTIWMIEIFSMRMAPTFGGRLVMSVSIIIETFTSTKKAGGIGNKRRAA